MEGESHIRYVIPPSSTNNRSDETETGFPSPEAILEATNRWNVAKDLSLKSLKDILSIDPDGPYHWKVEWNKGTTSSNILSDAKVTTSEFIPRLLEEDVQKTYKDNVDQTPPEVWIYGQLVGCLSIDTFDDILRHSSSDSSGEESISL